MTDFTEANPTSDGSTAFAVKYWMACVWLAIGVSIGYSAHGWRIAFALPPIAAALFQFSLAVVEVHDGELRYRRFLKWTTIQQSDVVACGLVWPPFIGYMRLTHPIRPWGRLYFVLDRRPASNWLRRNDFALLRYARRESLAAAGGTPNSGEGGKRAPYSSLIAAGAAGALLGLSRFILFDASLGSIPGRSVLEQPWQAHPSSWVGMLIRAELFFATPPAAAVICVAFLAIAVRRRHRSGTWPYAFLGGLALPFVLSHWLA